MKKVPAYRHQKSRNLAVVRINGKDFYLGRYGTPESKAAYKRLIGEWKAGGCATSYGVASDETTVAMLLADYLAHCDKHYPKTRGNESEQTRIAFRYLEPYWDVLASQFDSPALLAVRDAMLEATGKHGKPLSRSYINKMVDRIKRAFSWGVSRKIVKPDNWIAIKELKGLARGRTTAPESEKIKPVSDAVVEKTLQHTSQVIGDMIRFQRATGARPGEICAMTPSMIDQSGSVWIARLVHHKNAWRGKERNIFIGRVGQAIIERYLNRDPNAPLFSPKEADAERREKLRANRKTPLNSGNKKGTNIAAKPKRSPGTAYTPMTFNRAIAYACEKAWPTPANATTAEAAAWRAKYFWSPNQLRHAKATEVRAQHGLEAAATILGHSRLSMAEHYAAQSIEKGIEIAQMAG